MEEMIGIIKIFAGNFAPRGWAFCHGQLLAINSNSALYSILGTTYGGDGRTTFALPDLRSRSPLGAGQGSGLRRYQLGERGGQETVILNQQQIPAHRHPLAGEIRTAPDTELTNLASGNMLAHEARNENTALNMYSPAAPSQSLRFDALKLEMGDVGGGQAHENRPPFLGLNYIICLYGVYPARD